MIVRMPHASAMPEYTASLQKAGVLLEELGGCWTIEVKSKAEATVWASRCPVGDGEVIEVREV